MTLHSVLFQLQDQRSNFKQVFSVAVKKFSNLRFIFSQQCMHVLLLSYWGQIYKYKDLQMIQWCIALASVIKMNSRAFLMICITLRWRKKYFGQREDWASVLLWGHHSRNMPCKAASYKNIFVFIVKAKINKRVWLDGKKCFDSKWGFGGDLHIFLIYMNLLYWDVCFWCTYIFVFSVLHYCLVYNIHYSHVSYYWWWDKCE